MVSPFLIRGLWATLSGISFLSLLKIFIGIRLIYNAVFVSGVRNLFLHSVRKFNLPLANKMKKEPVKLSENVDRSVGPSPAPHLPLLFTSAGRREGRFGRILSREGLQTGSCFREKCIVSAFIFHVKVLTPSEHTGDFKQTTLPPGLLLEGGDLLFTPPPDEC